MKDKYFELYLIINSTIGRLIRGLIYLSALFLGGLTSPNPPFAIVAVIIINELFLDSLGRTRPKAKVSKSQQNPIDSLIFSARRKFEVNKESVKFFREKLGFGKIEASEVSGDELLKQAAEAVLWVEGVYITEVDLFTAYVLLSEDSTRFLQDNNLNNDDVINILYWTRRKFMPDKFTSDPIRILGPGVFDSLVESWNYELKKYSKDLTGEVLARFSIPNVVGREKEYEELLVALSRKKSSNVILVGEPGVGKMSLVEFLAYESFIGYAPKGLRKRRVFELFMDRLLSGINSAGELEARLSYVLEDIVHSENAILVIHGIESIFGGGGFNLDMSGVLVEYLESDKIKIIGTTTQLAYASFIENKPSVKDLFERIDIKELDRAKTLLLLTDKAREVELKYGVLLSYSALKQVAILAPAYFPDRFSPGRALDLLENVASKFSLDHKKKIDAQDVIEFVQAKTNIALSEPDERERELLLHLEEKMHKRVIGQEEAVSAIANTLRRLRSGFKSENRPISVMLFLGPTGVGKTETAKALAAEYFLDQNAMIRLDMSEYQTQDQIKRILGESAGEEVVANALTDRVEKDPFSLILLDEFEKAHPHLLDIFLQVFDEGRLTDNRGKTVSFDNTIIIATSNAGSELIRERINQGSTTLKDELVDRLLKNNIFKPELINRFDEVIVFRALTEEEILKISSILLSETLLTLSDNGIKIAFDDRVVSKIAKEAYDATFGARNIRRYIADRIESYLSKMILENKIRKSEDEKLSVDETGNFIII